MAAVAMNTCAFNIDKNIGMVTCDSGSKQILKQITISAIAYILHQRIDLDKNDFNTKNISGTTFKIFKNRMKNSDLNVAKIMVQSAMDAFNKNYLRDLYLILGDSEDKSCVYENYRFQFVYQELELDFANAFKADDAIQGSKKLFEAIGALNKYALLPSSTLIAMELTYYDDVTPANYEPPMFDNIEDSFLNLSNSYGQISLGFIKTGFHKVDCYGQAKTFGENTAASTMTKKTLEVDSSKIIEVLSNCTLDISVGVISSDHDMSVDQLIRCECGVDVPFEAIDEVICSICNTYQHAPCVGILRNNYAPHNYTCFLCNNKKDKILSAIEQEEHQRFCLFRLILAYICLTKKPPEVIINMLPLEKQSSIWFRIEKANLIKRQGHNIYVIEKSQLQNCIKRFAPKCFTDFEMVLQGEEEQESQ